MLTTSKHLPLAKRSGFSIAGLKAGFRSERSLRALGVACVLVGVVLRPAPIRWAIGLLVSAVVIAAELYNTALEQLTDHLHPAQHIKNPRDQG